MRFTYLFFSLLLCLSSYAQPNPINRRAMAIAGLAKGGKPDIPNIPGINTNLYLRWKTGDLPLNNKVSSWVDEIQGATWVMPDTTLQPTNSAIGVWFGGTQYMTNAGITFNAATYYTALWVLHLHTAGLPAYGQLLSKSSAISTDGYALEGANADTFYYRSGGGNSQGSLAVGNTTILDFFDLASGAPGSGTYTNNISTGFTPNSGALPGIWYVLGNTYNRDAPYKGYILELVVWTNTSTGFSYWDSTVRSNLHYYVTNTYSGISP